MCTYLVEAPVMGGWIPETQNTGRLTETPFPYLGQSTCHQITCKLNRSQLSNTKRKEALIGNKYMQYKSCTQYTVKT